MKTSFIHRWSIPSPAFKALILGFGLAAAQAATAETYGKVSVIIAGETFGPGSSINADSGSKRINLSDSYTYELDARVKSQSGTALGALLGSGKSLRDFVESLKPGSGALLKGLADNSDGILGTQLFNKKISGTKTFPNLGKVTISFNISGAIDDKGVCSMKVENVKFSKTPKLTKAEKKALGTLQLMGGSKLSVTASPVILFKRDSTGVFENEGQVVVPVTRDASRHGVVTVDYTTVAGSADSSDFTPTSGTLTFNDLDVKKDIIVPILNNNDNDGSRTFTIEISNPQGENAYLGKSSTQVLIKDED